MLVKKADDQETFLAALEQAASLPGPEGKRAAVELRNRRAGLRAEKDASYLIDFDFADAPNWAVIHDLRLEHAGRVAQIDHLLINRWLQVYVLETKHFHAGVKITEDGEFMRWNDFAKRYEGMASPLAQNERHIQVLGDVFDLLDLPKRAGFRIQPEFMPLVLVAPSARIDRPKRFDTSRVIKADTLRAKIWKDIDAEGTLFGMLKTAAKIVSAETVMDIARALAAKHRPLVKSEITAVVPAVPTSDSSVPAPPKPARVPSCKPSAAGEPSPNEREPLDDGPACKSCGRKDGDILYGKYGYYFKCAGCAANTAIRFTCKPGHEARLRKAGAQYFRECTACGSTSLYFTSKGPAR